DKSIRLIQAALHTRNIATEHTFRGIDKHGNSKDLLLDTIVQIARQAVAFLQYGKLFARVQQNLELFRHMVEILCQLSKFVTGRVPCQCSEVSLPPLIDREGESLETPGEATRCKEAKDGTDQSRQ